MSLKGMNPDLFSNAGNADAALVANAREVHKSVQDRLAQIDNDKKVIADQAAEKQRVLEENAAIALRLQKQQIADQLDAANAGFNDDQADLMHQHQQLHGAFNPPAAAVIAPKEPQLFTHNDKPANPPTQQQPAVQPHDNRKWYVRNWKALLLALVAGILAVILYNIASNNAAGDGGWARNPLMFIIVGLGAAAIVWLVFSEKFSNTKRQH